MSERSLGSPRHGDHTLERTQVVPATLAEAFAFFCDPWNLEAITPPWLGFEILDAPAELRAGSLLRYRLRLFGAPIHWRTEICEWRPPHGFTDRQLEGPYRLWVHTHRLAEVPGGTEIYDHVHYRLPAGAIGALAHAGFVRGWLAEIFDYRAAQTARLLRTAVV